MNSEAHCLSCGFKSERVFFSKTQNYVENYTDGVPDPAFDREGAFDCCPSCGSIDVDVFSPEGVVIMQRIAAVEARAA
jgi:Zn finger protein HypA/HybF involved in hydrogenase expression